MRVVFLSHTYLGSVFAVGSHWLSRQMSSRGMEVLHLSTPVTALHRCRSTEADYIDRLGLSRRGIHRDASGVHNFVPVFFLPAGLLPFAGVTWDLGTATAPRSFVRCLEKAGFTDPDLVLIDQPTLIGLKSVIGGKCWIYRPTDIYPLMSARPGVRRAERACLRECRAVVATSQPVLDHVRAYPEFAHPSMVLENGVEAAPYRRSYSRPLDVPESEGPKLIYVGAIDRRLDFDAITHLARRIPKATVILIGPVDERARACFSPYANIVTLGPRPNAAIPAYLTHADIALLPLSDDPSNAGRSPMKIYEYIAAGLPALCRTTSELVRRVPVQQGIHLYSTHEELLQLTMDMAKNRPERPRLNEIYCWPHITDTLIQFAARLVAMDGKSRACPGYS